MSVQAASSESRTVAGSHRYAERQDGTLRMRLAGGTFVEAVPAENGTLRLTVIKLGQPSLGALLQAVGGRATD